jgi:hypothetical protein
VLQLEWPTVLACEALSAGTTKGDTRHEARDPSRVTLLRSLSARPCVDLGMAKATPDS